MQTVSQAFPIRQSERAVLVGKTGSGKSTLAVALLEGYSDVFAIDTKGGFALRNARYVTDPKQLSGMEGGVSPIVYRPAPEYDNIDTNNLVLRMLYNRGNLTLYVDELKDLMEGARTPDYLLHILRKGRGLNIRTLCATQRPSRIPLDIISEAEHFFIFQLSLGEDRERMAGVTDEALEKKPFGEHGFWHYYTRAEHARQYILRLTPTGRERVETHGRFITQ